MMSRASWTLGWLMVLSAPAQADPDDPVDTIEVSDPLGEAEEAPKTTAPAVPPYSEGWRWVRRAPRTPAALTDVTVDPSDPAKLAAVDANGAVWLSRDAGRTWSGVLGQEGDGGFGLSNDEAVLLDVEAQFEDLVGGGGDVLADVGTDPDGLGDLGDALNQAGQELLTDLESDPGFVLGQTDEIALETPTITFVGDLLFASRDGALYLSRNDGRTWGRVLATHTYSVHPLQGAFVALTEDGARVALDPRAWFDVEDGTEGRALIDGAMAAEALVAATATGLWATRDGQRWERWGDLAEPVRALASHPARPEVLWAVTAEGLRRSDDRGLSFGPPVLGGRLTDVAAPLPDRVVVSRTGNVLESLDEGRTWAVASRGLEGLQGGRFAVRADGGLIMAAADGVWSLVPFADQAAVEAKTWVRLSELVDSSLARVGVRRDFDPFRRRYAAAFTPSLLVDARTSPVSGADWAPTQGTEAQLGRDWRIVARLQWTPRTSRNRATQDLDLLANLDAGVVVVDGDPLLLSGTDDYIVASRLDRAKVDYQAEVVSLLADLYRARTELIAERARLQDAALQRRVLHDLAISEIEARLDALTDGAVLRWEAQQSKSSQEL